jgi:HAD superfamily phosphatase (TIGR01681 family)
MLPNNCKLVIFDLDDTLRRRYQYTIDIHIIDILKLLKNSGVKIALASLNKMASADLFFYGIYNYFDQIEHSKFDDEYPNEKKSNNLNTKTEMFKKISLKLNIPYENTILFDDNWYHCMEAKWLKIKYICIRQNYILKWSDLYNGFNLFKQHNLKRKSCTF